ncbi:hypothetical protein CC80DRAFT_491625 [Byssothecium circinans]|uniref:Uncharacterized protein n=1 Tax=Byssothecium circinans TaxID=147558 RepID=A0A6A5U3I1_9PLEO|nr:hypothetical protein CC80DRAFT_491625 [Byssothecium circinans]
MPPQREKCTQYQIRYTCGHSLNSEFVKCKKHESTDQKRPGVNYEEEKQSTHKCRSCNQSE